MNEERTDIMRTRTDIPPASTRSAGAEIGRLVVVGGGGEPWVDYPSAPSGPRLAVLAAPPPTGALEGAIGRHVVLLFEGGDPERPLIVGWVEETPDARVAPSRTVRVDGERILLQGTREVVLECGEASVTLTADGKLVLRGVQIVSDAQRLNRIRGAAVRIN